MASLAARKAVADLLRTLSTTWPRSYGATPEAKAEMLDAWCLALASADVSVLPEVAQRLLQTSKYPPRPAEALAIARQLAPRVSRATGYSPAPPEDDDPDLRCVVAGCGCGPLVLAVRVPGATVRYWHRHDLAGFPEAVIVSTDWRDPVGMPGAAAPVGSAA